MNGYLQYIGLFLGIALLSACSREEEFGIEKRPGYSIYGLDVSKYQEKMDWAKIARDSIKFVFIKATQGVKGRDKYFDENWEAAKKHGILRGAYHFFENTDPLEALQQAQNFVGKVGYIEPGDLPPVLDIERKPFKKKHVQSVKAWLYWVEFYCGVRPIIYTGEYYYNKYLAGELPGYTFWIARYSDKAPVLKDKQKWTFWQYTSSQRNIFATRKNKGRIDLNAFAGTEEDLLNLRVKPRDETKPIDPPYWLLKPMK